MFGLLIKLGLRSGVLTYTTMRGSSKLDIRDMTFCRFFSVRRHAKRGIYHRRVSVCVCVCLTHSGTISKRLNVGSRK